MKRKLQLLEEKKNEESQNWEEKKNFYFSCFLYKTKAEAEKIL